MEGGGSSRLLQFEDGTVANPIDYAQCLFKGTLNTYVDCCTDSSIKVCNYLMVMFFACFIVYLGTFIYIMNKKNWIKDQGLYVNVFTFQMCVLLCNLSPLTL